MLNFNKTNFVDDSNSFFIVTYSDIDVSLQQKINKKFNTEGYNSEFIKIEKISEVDDISTTSTSGIIIYLNSDNKESMLHSLSLIRKKLPYNIPIVVFDKVDSYSLIDDVKSYNAIYYYCNNEVELPSQILKLDLGYLISEFGIISSSLSNSYAERVLIIPMQGGLGSSYLAKKIIEQCSQLKIKSLLRTLSSNRDSDILFTSKIKKQSVILPGELSTHNDRYRAMKEAVFNIDRYSDSYHAMKFKSEDEIEMVKILDNNYNFILDIGELSLINDIDIEYYDKVIFILSKTLSSVRNLSQFIIKNNLKNKEVILIYNQSYKTVNFTDHEIESVIGSNVDIKSIQSFNKKITKTDFQPILNSIFNIENSNKSAKFNFWS